MYYKIRWLNQSKQIENVYGTGQTPWKVDSIHIVFDQYTSSDILKFRAIHFVSKEVLEIIRHNQFTGLGICRPVEIEINDGYTMYPPLRIFKQYYLLAVHGTPGQDDIGMTLDCQLVISGDVLDALSEMDIHDVEIIELEAIKYLRKKKYKRI